ncbi:MAG: PcfJ domain-containing protein [Thiotrichaceae bacterium]|nr:PcfJ domain-containing protein [Thiotrichaceae bacterium]
MIHYSDENDLIIDYSKIIGYPCLLTVTSWEKGITWKSVAGEERVFQKNYLDETGVALHQTYNGNKQNKWLNTIPKDLLSMLLDYEKNYFYSAYPLLYLLSHHQNAIDLFKSSQVLMAILMYSAEKNNWNEEYVVNLLNGKRVDIIDACGLPRRKSTLKTLNKIEGIYLSPLEYNAIKIVLSLPNAHLINHLNSIDIGLIYLIANHNEFIASSLISRYHKEWLDIGFRYMYIDTKRMLGRAGSRHLKKCATLDELKKIHKKCIIKLNEENKKKREKIKKEMHERHERNKKNNEINKKNNGKVYFSQPPVKGNKYIIPITNSHDLMDEGIDQRHCVASYQDEIVNGKSYIYKVLEPERATLQILILGNNKYRRAQLKLSCNQSPSKETVQMVEQWMKKAFE